MSFIAVINGPNLNLNGRRQTNIYGTQTLNDIAVLLQNALPHDKDLRMVQSNSEGEIIDMLHRIGFDPECTGIILNAGAYTHYSYAIADAVAAIERPVIEVHMSNIDARENFRRRSVIAPYCRGSIAGFGADSYILAAIQLCGLS